MSAGTRESAEGARTGRGNAGRSFCVTGTPGSEPPGAAGGGVFCPDAGFFVDEFASVGDAGDDGGISE